MGIIPYHNPVNISQFVNTQYENPFYCSISGSSSDGFVKIYEALESIYNMDHFILREAFGLLSIITDKIDEFLTEHMGTNGWGLYSSLSTVQNAFKEYQVAILDYSNSMALTAQSLLQAEISTSQLPVKLASKFVKDIRENKFQMIKAIATMGFLPLMIAYYGPTISTASYIESEIFYRAVLPLLMTSIKALPSLILHHPYIAMSTLVVATIAGSYFQHTQCQDQTLIESDDFLRYLALAVTDKRSQEIKTAALKMMPQRICSPTDHLETHLQMFETLKYLIEHPQTQRKAISEQKFDAIRFQLSFLYEARIIKEYQEILNSMLNDAMLDEQTKQYTQQTLSLINSIPKENIEKVKSVLRAQALKDIVDFRSNPDYSYVVEQANMILNATKESEDKQIGELTFIIAP